MPKLYIGVIPVSHWPEEEFPTEFTNELKSFTLGDLEAFGSLCVGRLIEFFFL